MGSKGPEVTILQTEMNKWFTKLGFDPIPDSEIHSGTYGPKTQEAVRIFQENHVIKQDCIVGPSTRDILALENNENFQKLDLNTQYKVKSQMASYEDMDITIPNAIPASETRGSDLDPTSSICRISSRTS